MAFPPEVFLIGAQKAGTTYLATLLDEHPRITLSTPKEPGFFTRHWDKGPDWYRKKFLGPEENIFIDASTSYSAAQLPEYSDPSSMGKSPFTGVPKRIHSISPRAKFIYLLRDPVERTYSSYWHDVRQGHETRPFREALMNNSFYLRVGSYAEQLRLYLEYFPLDRFLLLRFEDLKKAPLVTANQCFKFLGLEQQDELKLDAGKHKSFAYRGWIGSLNTFLSNVGGVGKLIKIIKPLIPQTARSVMGGMITKDIPKMNDDDRSFLIGHFREKNKELEKLTGITIDVWQ